MLFFFTFFGPEISFLIILLGKGGKKLGVGGGLIKSLPEKSFQEWTKIHKESTKKLIQKRKEIQHCDVGASPAFDKSKQKGHRQSHKMKTRKCGD